MRNGKVTQSILNRSVLKPIRNKENKKSAAVGTDCAFCMTSNGDYVLTSSCPVSLNTVNKAAYAITGAVNNLYAMGASSVDMITLTVMLSQDAEEDELKSIMRNAAEAAALHNTSIYGGHTEVTSGSIRTTVVATAIAHVTAEDICMPGRVQPGDGIIVTKWVGIEGTAMLAQNKREELISRYPAPFIDEGLNLYNYMSINSEAAVAIKSGVSAMHDVSGSGIFAALWEMAEGANVGLEVNLKEIPIRQETIEICEYFELNPYEILSGGSLLIASSKPETVVEALHQNGIPAQIIGKFVEGKGRIIYNEEESRYLDKPVMDEIHKVL